MLIPCIIRVLFEFSQSDMELLEHVSLPLYLSVLLQLDGVGNGMKKALLKSSAKCFVKMSCVMGLFFSLEATNISYEIFCGKF